MNESSKVIIKNTSVLMVSQLITWCFAFLLTLFLPRYIGPAGYGLLGLAAALWSILNDLINFGTGTYLTKEIARDHSRASVLVGAAVLLRGLFFLGGGVVLAGYLAVMQYPPETVAVILIIGAAQPFWHMINITSAALRGIEAMEYISIADVIGKAVNLAVTFVIMVLDLGIYAIASTTTIMGLISAIIQYVGLRRHTTLRLRLSRSETWTMLRGSFPFLIAGLVFTAYFQIDTLIMAALVHSEVLGWYNVAINLTGTMLFLPTVLTSAIFPAFARSYSKSDGASSRLLGKSVDLMFLCGVPVGLGVASIAHQLAVFLYGPAFAPAGALLALQGTVVIFTYLATVIGQYIIATDRVNTWTALMAGAVILTIPGDLLLIPWAQRTFGNGAIGGSLTFLLTEFAMAAGGLLLLPRGSLGWRNVRVASLVLLAGLVMMGACWFVRDMFILVPIGVGFLSYTAVILLTRAVPSADRALILDGMRALIGRLRSRFGRPVPAGET